MNLPHDLRRAYRLMRRHFGHQNWWPGDTPFEVCVGAILTQNTSWTHVERAIINLKAADLLHPQRLLDVPPAALGQLLRPAGYFNVKARRLQAFVAVLVRQFNADLGAMMTGPTEVVRDRLLAIPGIGPETADSMLLYASNHLRFVVDAYTRRIFARHRWCDPLVTYTELQHLCESSLAHGPKHLRLDAWRDYHAQLVMVGKVFCRPRNPCCDRCPLSPLLPPRPQEP